MTPLGMAVVPEVNRISQMSSPCTTASGSETGWPSINSANDTPPRATAPPMGMVTSGARPAAPTTSATPDHNSASTITNQGSTSSIWKDSTTGGNPGMTGTATNKALAES